MPTKSAQTKGPIIRNLVGGLNCREAITDIADNENIASSNLNYYTAGSVQRRGGWVKLFANSPTALPLLGIYQATFASGTVLVITDGVGIWYTTNPTAATVTWVSIIGGASLDNTQPYHFSQMGGTPSGGAGVSILLIYNGVSQFYWTGPSNNIAAYTLPTGTYCSLAVGPAADILLTAVASGTSLVTFKYTGGATAGSEVVSVSGNAISVQIQNGVSTAAQIVTALTNSMAASALVVATTAVGTNAQLVSSEPTATLLAAPYVLPPASRIGIVWQNYMWFASGNNLQFSSLGDGTTYPVANTISVPDPYSVNDPITGVSILYGNLLVFKRYSFYILQGTPPGNLILSKLNSSVGCVEPASVVQIDNLVYFVSDKGLYAANLFNVQQKCYKVEPRYLGAVPLSTTANPIWAAHYKPKNQIFLSVNCQSLYKIANITGYNDRILVHDYFNADQNGDPATSEFVVGSTVYGLEASKPAYPTAPSIMGDYAFATGTTTNATVMASFYDPFVYLFQDGALPYGGPPDNVSWLASPIYPQTDFLSKFFDAGDPDMIKQVRWLWTTAQTYNGVDLAAGIVYNNSPTADSFVDFNVDLITLKSPNGNLWSLGVDDDGAFDITSTTDPTYLTTLVLMDVNGNLWNFGIDNTGAIVLSSASTTAVSPPTLASPSGFQYQVGVDLDGAPKTTAVFAPSVMPIVPGARVAVYPIVNGVAGASSGKYWQIYFTGIGILSQYSMDIIMKGRRN
jgi:hypothetical protein